MSRSIRCLHCGQMHEATVSVCPVTQAPMQPSRQLVVPRPIPPSHEAVTPSGPPPRANRRALVGQTIDGKYKVRAVLGEGGMGAVFEAEHTAIGRIVAMKVLHPAQATKKVAVKRFHQEARAAGGIGHPNICEVFDFGTLSDGSPYLVMERLKGETLAARITTEGGLPFIDVIDAVTQVLSGLAAAHAHGILHRDIKPENVFLSERAGFPAIAKLLDFGVSKVVSGAPVSEWDDETDLTKTGMVMGTPYYMSPEQARGDRNLDGRVDIYACGVLLFEALTGQRPFNAKNYNALLVLILQGNPPAPRSLRASIPPELEHVVLKAMARNRDDRFQTAAELSHALAPIRRNLVKSTSGASPSARMAAHTPSLSQSSTDIPIHFSESEIEVVHASDEWDQTTAPMMEVPSSDQLPDEGASPYDDETESQNETLRVDPRDVKAVPQKRVVKDDESTDRMNQADIQAIVDAVREAREREKKRGQG